MNVNNMRVHYLSQRGDWGTPPAIFDPLDEEFDFTLDVCASEENAKCDRYYTEDDDGLEQPWHGTVWGNFPYGRGIGRWVEKAIRESRRGVTIVMLVPARTDSIWFQQLIANADEIRFLSGRVRFEGAENNAPFPSAIAILRPPRTWATNDERLTFAMPTRHDEANPWKVVRRVD